MRGVETRIQEIRHKIFTEVARMAYHTEWYVKDRMEALPYKIIPGEKRKFQERCIFGACYSRRETSSGNGSALPQCCRSFTYIRWNRGCRQR